MPPSLLLFLLPLLLPLRRPSEERSDEESHPANLIATRDARPSSNQTLRALKLFSVFSVVMFRLT
jgi:hypothetical protein